MLIIPAFSAPIAAVAPPPCTKFCKEPIGAKITGNAIFFSRIETVVSISDTSLSIFGRSALESIDARFLLNVVSEAVPPIT